MMRITELKLHRNHAHIIQDSNLNRGKAVLRFPHVYSLSHLPGKEKKKRTICGVAALSRQGTVSFQSPLLKQKILWAKLPPQTSLFMETKKDHNFFLCVCWLLMEKHYKILIE